MLDSKLLIWFVLVDEEYHLSSSVFNALYSYDSKLNMIYL